MRLLKTEDGRIFGAVAALILASFWPVWSGLASDWMHDAESTHCGLIPILSAYLIYQKRDEVGGESARESLAGLAALFAGVFFYWISLVGGVLVFQRLALVTVINAAVLFHLGWDKYRRILFPMLFLFLMIPVPVTLQGMISFPLQLFATSAARTLIDALGIPVAQSGNILRLPAGALEVVEACSGVRSLFAFLTLGLFFAYWSGGSAAGKAILVASTVPIALAANVLRITFSGVVAQTFGMKAARGFLHDFSGVALFLGGLLVFMLEARLLAKAFPEKDAGARA